MCGKNNSDVLAGDASFVAGVVVIRNSPRSLYRVRRLTTLIGPEALIRRSPRNGMERPGNNSCRNLETWPEAGTTTLAVCPVLAPFSVVNSKFTVAEAAEEFAIA